VADRWDPDSVYEVLASEEARAVLAMTSDRAMSAGEIAERLSVAEPTVYRRLNVLEEYGYLVGEREVDPDGNHYETYRATLSRLEVDVGEGTVTVETSLRDAPGKEDRFGVDAEGRHEVTEDPLDVDG
jgi:DNA-binding transcriptional ArsR family regulator